MTPPFPPVALPPATAEYLHTVQHASPGAAPQQVSSRLFRSADGKTRVDTGNTSLITDPAAGRTVLLDHLKKQARVMPTPPAAPPQPGQAPPPPGMPGFALPHAPLAPAVNVKDLGKSVINGHEVVGKQFTFTPPVLPGKPAAPTVPGMPAAPRVPGMPAAAAAVPGMPSAPALPGMPAAPALPGAPAVPGAPPLPKPGSPTVAEVWTSTKMHLPMLTKTTGPFAQATSQCHSAVPGEPHPSVFQIPAGYKLV
ncbi:MAG TPA: hypothetical protein VG096_02450 [Bryobacteraceae bacterium]|nr:hypothetical protein [Bryobacteraceae bacterium]